LKHQQLISPSSVSSSIHFGYTPIQIEVFSSMFIWSVAACFINKICRLNTSSIKTFNSDSQLNHQLLYHHSDYNTLIYMISISFLLEQSLINITNSSILYR
jgi:hypothetical protein